MRRLLERWRGRHCDIGVGVDITLHTTTVVYYCKNHETLFVSGPCPGRRSR